MGAFALFVFNFAKCKLTYNLLFDLYFSLFRLLLDFGECNCQLSSFVKMSESFLTFTLSFSMLCSDTVIFLLSSLKDSLGDNCSISRHVWFLLSSLTVSVKSGTKCPLESDSAVVLAILLTAPPLKCYKVLEPDPPDKKKVILCLCTYFHWQHWIYAILYMRTIC